MAGAAGPSRRSTGQWAEQDVETCSQLSMSAWRSRPAISVGSGGMVATADWLLAALPQMGVTFPPSGRLFAARRLIQDVHSFKVRLCAEDPATLGRVAEAQRTLTEFYIIARAIESPRVHWTRFAAPSCSR